MDAIFLVNLKIYIRAKMGFSTFQNLFSRNSRVIEIYGQSDQSMMQLEIHDQSMTMLTMLTNNSKNAPERRVHRTEVYTCSKSMTNPWPCWRCWPKMQIRTRKAGASNQSWHVLQRENLNKTRNLSNSRPQNGQIMRKHNEPKMAHFPNTSISTGILNYLKVSWSTLSNNSIFREIPWQLVTLSTAMKFPSKFFGKWSFFDQHQQPLNSVEPFERILRALFISQCPYKFSSFLDLRNASNRFRLFARDFRLFRFFFSGSACFSKLAPPRNLPSWVQYYGKYESFGKEFRLTKFIAVERITCLPTMEYSKSSSSSICLLSTTRKQRQDKTKQF